MKLAVILALAMTAGSPGMAQAVGSSVAAAAKPASIKRICRRDIPTGSIMPGPKICMTEQEWKQVDGVGQESSEAFLNRAIRPVSRKEE